MSQFVRADEEGAMTANRRLDKAAKAGRIAPGARAKRVLAPPVELRRTSAQADR
jgi:hypothetical protein